MNGKVHLIHVMDPTITSPVAALIGAAFNHCDGQIVTELDSGDIRIEFPDRERADAFKKLAQSIGQVVVELQ